MNREFCFQGPVLAILTACFIALGGLGGCGPHKGARAWRNNPQPVITGKISADGKPIHGATVSVNNVRNGATAVTDIHGNYVIRVPYGWSGVLTPMHGDYAFAPEYIDFGVVIEDRAGIDISGAPRARPDRIVASAPRRVGLDEECIIDRDCDDGIYCNGFESCMSGRCRPGDPPCDAALTCDEESHRCVACTVADACDDGLFCNGLEDCVDGRCAAGTRPCPESLYCDESAKRCIERAPGVVSVTLVDADRDQPIRGITLSADNTELDLAGLPRLALGATTHPETVGSVRFKLSRDGAVEDERIHNTAPYALFGAPDGNFKPWPGGQPKPGQYELIVTSYTGADGAGETMEPLTVQFSIRAPAECAADADCDDGRYCNGPEACVDGRCITGTAPCGEDETCDERRDACRATCANDQECDDGMFCNGVEICLANVCAVGTPPCAAGLLCNESQRTCDDPPAQVYYVDDDANLQPLYDSSAPAGSQQNPFRTLRHAANVVKAGDTVIIREGRYDSGVEKRSEPVVRIRTDGTRDAPITFRAAEGERAVVSGATGATETLIDVAAAYINIEGLELTGARRIAILVRGPESHHVNVRMCHAHHNDHDRWIGGAFRTQGPVSDVLFEDCISNNNSNGFQLRDDGNQTNNTASVPPRGGNKGYAVDMPESEWDSWPGWDFAARRVTLRRCIAYDNKLIAEHSDGIALRYAVDCVFEDCIAFRNVDDNFDMLAATRCIARRNIAFQANHLNTKDGDGNGIKIGVRGGLDNIAHHNICFDNRRGGIDMADTERAQVYNNTCLGNHEWFGIWFEAGRSRKGVIVQNNLCRNHAKKGDIGLNGNVRTAKFDHNLVSDKNRHNWAHSPGRGGLKNKDPMFTNEDLEIDVKFTDDMSIRDKLDFIRRQVYEKVSLKLGSPAVDAGAVVPGITTDYLGKGPDIGAVESH